MAGARKVNLYIIDPIRVDLDCNFSSVVRREPC